MGPDEVTRDPVSPKSLPRSPRIARKPPGTNSTPPKAAIGSGGMGTTLIATTKRSSIGSFGPTFGMSGRSRD